MDQIRFDALTRLVSGVSSRRHLLRGLVGTVLGMGAVRLPGVMDAKKKRRKKRGKKPKPNAFGCFDVGMPCNGDSAKCCSGICQGKKPKKGKKDTRRCTAHDASICTVESDFCSSGQQVFCGVNNPYCACTLTTGNAPFCGDYTGFPGDTLCRNCSQDTDCHEEFGPRAACVVYSRLCGVICPDTGTACVPACNDSEL